MLPSGQDPLSETVDVVSYGLMGRPSTKRQPRHMLGPLLLFGPHGHNEILGAFYRGRASIRTWPPRRFTKPWEGPLPSSLPAVTAASYWHTWPLVDPRPGIGPLLSTSVEWGQCVIVGFEQRSTSLTREHAIIAGFFHHHGFNIAQPVQGSQG